jgi:hypothetical protein
MAKANPFAAKGKAKGAGGNPFAKGRVPTTKGPPANDPLAAGGGGGPPIPMGPGFAKGGKVDPWDKTSRGKKDAAFDKKMGIKPGSATDNKIDRLVKGKR